jgi:hypothetical protein
MALGRTILAFMIALSVAMLPAAGGMAVASTADVATMTDSSMADTAMMDCCPGSKMPFDKAAGNCCAMAACALKCFGFSGTTFSDLVFPPSKTTVEPSRVRQGFRSREGNPPFRPPRV